MMAYSGTFFPMKSLKTKSSACINRITVTEEGYKPSVSINCRNSVGCSEVLRRELCQLVLKAGLVRLCMRRIVRSKRHGPSVSVCAFNPLKAFHQRGSIAGMICDLVWVHQSHSCRLRKVRRKDQQHTEHTTQVSASPRVCENVEVGIVAAEWR